MRGLIFTDMDATLLDHDTYDFSASRPALEAARRAGVRVVLCSSKTLAEMVPWQQRLELDGPLIVETGSAVVWTGAGPSPEGFEAKVADYPAKVWGAPYGELREVLAELRERTGAALRGFGDMDAAEVSRRTGLNLREAAEALVRHFSESFVWEPEPAGEQVAEVTAWLEARGLRLIRGGRFWHLTGAADKGAAARWLRSVFEQQRGAPIPAIALGDSPNDVTMLTAVDRGFLVKRPRTGHLDVGAADVEKVDGVGPAGWAAAVTAWLATLEYEA